MRHRMIAIIFASGAVSACCAQDAFTLDNLSAHPRLHEHAQAYTVEVRFTTAVPAVAHVQFGPDATCAQATAPESEPLRNHRFDLADVPLDERRFVRVVARREGQEVASEVIEIAPPRPFPAGTARHIEVPLTVTETAGVARDEPVTFGIPLPQGALGAADRVTLSDGPTALPISTRALLRWPDGTIKWLLVSGRVALAADATKTLRLALGADVVSPAGRRPAMVRADGDRIEVDTGAVRLSIDRGSGAGTIATAGGALCPLPTSRLTAVDGSVYVGRAEHVTVEEDGPDRAVILVEGHHVGAAGEPYFGFALRYFLHVGDPCVRVDHILRHDLVSPEMKYGDEMKSFAALDLVFSATGDAQVALDEGGTATLAPGQRLFQHFDDAWELGAATGRRAPGLMTMGGLSVAVRDFWQNWPKSLEAEEGALVVGLYPRITPADRYANRPDEHIHYYHLRDGNYTFRAGLEKRHELLIAPAAQVPAEQMLARANVPLLVTAPPEWYTGSGAVHNIVGLEGRDFARYDVELLRAVEGFVDVRESNHWYGLMNFGDWYGERGNNWGNIEYDMQHSLLTGYFRSGERALFEVAEQAARHNADIDVVHYAAGQVAGPGGPRRVGPAWVHSMCHTGGYYPYDYLGMDIYAQGYCENRGHMWNQGNLEYWLLTGDQQVHRSAMQLADWVAGANMTDFSYGNARVPGWMGIIAMSTYFATYDEYYLNAMRLMYDEVKAKADPDAGLWVHELSPGHCYCEVHHYGEAGFMAGVLMTALKYYYEATGDEEIAERIVKIANFIVDTMYEPKVPGFRYTSCPETEASSSAAMIMGNGLAFAANYAQDRRLMEITRDQFVRGFVGFVGGDHGKTIGYATCAAPLAIAEISRFPGPTLDELVEEVLEAAGDPARRPLPGIMPNPDFETGIDGWVVRGSLSLAPSTDVVHSGSGAAMATGSIEGQNEYFVTRYACGPPWEIMALAPGESYRMQLWLRVDEIGAGIPAPSARVSVRSQGVTRRSFTTNAYDLARLGTWQLLQVEFTVPEGTDAAYVAVNTNTREPQQVRMYLDDVAIVPAATSPRAVYFYPSAGAEQATVVGGVTLAPEGPAGGWEVLSAADGATGSARFTLNVPVADNYRLLVRVKSPDAAAAVSVALDGRDLGELAVGQDRRWAWREAGGGVGLNLAPGEHEVIVTWPAGSGVLVQKVALTNESAP